MNNTVMIIEDDYLNMKLVTDLLQIQGYRIIQSTNGDDAEKLVLTHAPDLILMDIKLPGRSGLQITHSLKSNPEMKRIPIIALTALTQFSHEDICFEYGCDDYIQKPLSISHFFETVDRYLSLENRVIN